jgi:hypothetical protein
MKTITKLVVFLLFTFHFSLSTVFAQVPQAINFQAIARDGYGNPMVNTNIQIRLSVIDSALGGSIVYQELRALQTNAYGSFSFQIGVAPAFTTIGTFQSINWVTGNKHLKIDYDPTNTFTFSLTLGVIEFVTVPYAFTAETVVYIDADGAQNGDVLKYNSVTGKFEPGQVAGSNYTAGTGISIVGNVITNTGDVSNTNELQTLSISNDTLYLTNGGFVKLPTASSSVLQAPTVTVQAATDLDITTVTLNGTVNANGLSTSVIFEYGLTTTYGSTSTATQSPVTGTANTPVSKGISSLQGNTTYHYRIKTSNAVNVSYSNDMTFTTTWPSVPTVTTSNFSDVKGNSAKAGGSVTYNGGSPVTAQGLCWSTSTNPTISNSINTSFTATMTGLSPNTTYYVRAYATNLAGTGYGNEISFISGKVIGSTFGGGLVFYNDGAGHGLVCAPTDQSTSAQWGCYGTAIGGTLTAINTGFANTNAIVAGCSTAGIAARLCDTLTVGGFTDWYLPAKDELNLMYVNLHTQSLGSFASNYYWSSSEIDASNAWKQSFSNGYQGHCNKDSTYYVRAVRAF